MENVISGIFPCPVYGTKRDTNLSSREKKEIGKIIKEGMYTNYNNSSSNNNYIFNTKLKKIKQFCEEHIKIYVKEVINPKNEIDFYITQSWLNITKPQESHHPHFHTNSIISGVFYISTEEDDNITFLDPAIKVREPISFDKKGPETYLWSLKCFCSFL